MITPRVWKRAEPRAFQKVLADVRALWTSRDTRDYKQFAADLGYESTGKTVNLRTAGDRLRRAADAGDKKARLRIQRADALAALLDSTWWGDDDG